MASEVASTDLSSENKSPKKESAGGGGSMKKEVKLNDLRVADLRTELENRGLDKSGVKASLMERLKKALEDEGKNPEDFVFEITTDTPSKKSKRAKESVVESKSNDGSGGMADQESDNDEDEEKQNDSVMVIENGEILQLSVDDKEATLDGGGKENAGKGSDIEEEEENTSDSAGELAATDEAGTDPKMGIVIDDSEDTVEKPEEKSEDGEITKASAAGSTTPKTEKAATAAAAAKPQTKPAAEAVAKTAPARNIWITGLSSATRAADLKGLFSQQGKVASVKIVTNAKQVSGEKKYYGFITMSASKDAAKAVETLKDTELYGQCVHLELTAHQPGTLLKRTTAKPAVKKVKTVTDATKVAATQKVKKDSESKEGDEGSEKEKEERRRDRERERRSREPRDYRPPFRRPFGFRYRGRGRGGYTSFRERVPAESFRPFTRKPFFSRMPFRPPMKSSRFMGYRMREDRISRDRFREREIRESERRREEAFRHKMIERKQREEAYRLEREKVQLRIEREMLERERAEILKLEREKQRLERERLEREKEKLRRQTQMREGQKRPYPGPTDVESVWEKDKRPRHYESSRYPGYSPKPHLEPRQEYRESPQVYNRHKFEARSEHFERDAGGPSSRPDFSKYKDKPEGQRDHDERRVGYKRNYFREEASRPSYPQREPDRAYAPSASPRDERFKPRMHDVGGSSMRAPRSRGGGRRMPYY